MNSRYSAALAVISLACATSIVAPASAAPVFVSDNFSTPTAIGVLVGGSTYTVTATGVAALCGGCDAGHPLYFSANGLPVSPSPEANGSYAAFSPNGLDHDPTGSSFNGTGYGQGGQGVLIGSLLGTFNPTPTGAGDFFVLGESDTFVASGTETLYAVINDTIYGDNPIDSGYSVTVTLVQADTPPGGAVPEPASLSLAALGMVGLVRARRRKSARSMVVPHD